MTKTVTLQWGIIRYAAGSGWCPDADCAAFDGWYSDKTMARAVFKSWCRLYPKWVVALVKADTPNCRFPNADWAPVIRPYNLPEGTLCPLKRENNAATNS